jgi:hypothetical protein
MWAEELKVAEEEEEVTATQKKSPERLRQLPSGARWWMLRSRPGRERKGRQLRC